MYSAALQFADAMHFSSWAQGGTSSTDCFVLVFCFGNRHNRVRGIGSSFLNNGIGVRLLSTGFR
jgi:hypothetical protein